MEELNLTETQLYRLLTSVFGRECVIPRMRVIAICGGELPDSLRASELARELNLSSWARAHRGLFTIVDADDSPRLVVEFFSSTTAIIDVDELEHHRRMQPILAAAGIRYITISENELAELLDPRGTLDVCTFLTAKVDSASCAE